MRIPVSASLAAALCVAAVAIPASAETWAWTCQGVLTTPDYRKTGRAEAARVPVELTADTAPGGRIAVRSRVVNLDLETADPADPDWAEVYRTSPGPAVHAEGTGRIRMFDKASVETCASRIRKARPSATTRDQDMHRCYQDAPMTPDPVPVEVSFSAFQQGAEKSLSIAFFHAGQDYDDALLDIMQLNLNGPCTSK